MRIAFPVVRAGSGSDVYYTRLQAGLQRLNIRADIIWLGYAVEFVPGWARRLRRQVQKYDLIHTNADYGALLRVPGRPLVVTLHHNVLDPIYQRWTTPAQKLYHYLLLKGRLARSLRATDAAICVSRATGASVARTFPVREQDLTVIYNGIDLRVFSPGQEPAPGPPFQVLFVGNLSRRKGADLLPAIMERLGEEYRLVCVSGSGGQAPVGPRTTVLPFQKPEALAEFYRQSHVLLFPSRLEGFGYVAAEAMGCARPVVCGNRSSLPELIDDDKGGILCNTEDIDACVAGIRRVVTTPGLANAMGRYNRTKAEQLFDIDRTVRAYADLYERILRRS